MPKGCSSAQHHHHHYGRLLVLHAELAIIMTTMIIAMITRVLRGGAYSHEPTHTHESEAWHKTMILWTMAGRRLLYAGWVYRAGAGEQHIMYTQIGGVRARFIQILAFFICASNINGSCKATT